MQSELICKFWKPNLIDPPRFHKQLLFKMILVRHWEILVCFLDKEIKMELCGFYVTGIAGFQKVSMQENFCVRQCSGLRWQMQPNNQKDPVLLAQSFPHMEPYLPNSQKQILCDISGSSSLEGLLWERKCPFFSFIPETCSQAPEHIQEGWTPAPPAPHPRGCWRRQDKIHFSLRHNRASFWV